MLQSGFPHCLLFCHQFFLLHKYLLLSSLILYRLIFIPRPPPPNFFLSVVPAVDWQRLLVRLQEEGEHDQGKVALVAGHRKQTYADLLEVAADVEEGEEDDSTRDLLDEEAVMVH